MEPIINGRYAVLRELGRGGMGRVYLVVDRQQGERNMALKTMMPEAVGARGAERFRVEFTGLAKLRHPNIASACDFGRIAETGEFFFTSEYVRGVDVFRGTEGASLERILHVMVQTLRGLDCIHSHGFLHNDLKPSNILLESCDPRPEPQEPSRGGEAGDSRQQQVKIIDFGLFSAENVAWDRFLGTPHFLSPERICGMAADRRSDLYSLGFIFYLLLARVFPFSTNDADVLMNMHLFAPVRSLANLRRDLPRTVVGFVERLMKKRPDERFESAGAAVKYLEEKVLGATELRSVTLGLGDGAMDLLGREKDLINLESHWCAVNALVAETCCLALMGAPGSGKTRLVRELRGLVQTSGGAFIEIAGGAGLPAAAEAVHSGIEMTGAAAAATSSAPLPGRPQENVARECEALLSLIREAAGRMPVLVHFEDYHQSADDLRAFAIALVRAANRRARAGEPQRGVFVVLSSVEDVTRLGLDASECAVLNLEPFPADLARDFVCKAFGQADIPAWVLDEVVAAGGGFPGPLLAASRGLVAARRAAHNGNRWVFAETVAEPA